MFVELGSQVFNTEKLGIEQSDKVLALDNKPLNSYKTTPDYEDGLFIFDTRETGNHNTGHIFDDSDSPTKTPGRIGRLLSNEEKMAIIEYLKTL